ncbi:phosphatidylserine decarboxylase [Haloprofundus marisrubri]|uniref:Putative archaetidylserine decarboxylase proenzyme n=1 Tax=Haloprofundus marisrubri TaxID=1514971 RepID=A0A0W1R454_9EURY|nr:protein sorting system archaetidylserine decarboxylase [Haloprofundus marisrubri]KTG08177.1 phosphatidylserine decarboxylase [Haloprofundus marisrubri]
MASLPARLSAAVPRQFAPSTRRYALPPAILAVLLSVFVPPLGLLFIAVTLFVLWFFRDPERVAPDSGFVSPADGRVSVIRREDDRVRVGVFMNVTNVHVNRAPADATVESVTHRPGAHKPAFSKDSERNERVDVDCGEFEVSLIAGAFARRIHPYVEDGVSLERGQRIGHIAFGSRADVLLPERFDATDVCVKKGQRVRAGETVVARQS